MALIRQVKDRSKRQRGSRKEVEKKETYPDQRVLYRSNTLKGKLFLTLEDQEEALAAGWIIHPGMSLEAWLKTRGRVKEPEEKHVNHLDKFKLRDSELPPRKRYVSQMNVTDLIKEGLKYGIDYTNPENRPIKVMMIKKIQAAQDEAK